MEGAQAKLIITVSLDKKERNEAYLQASEFQIYIDDKKDELKEQVAEETLKYPMHKEYIESILNMSNVNDVETEMNVLNCKKNWLHIMY